MSLSHINLGPDANMQEMAQALWRLPRDLVSDGYDSALRELSRQVPMQIHEYATGTPCFTWSIPPKWTCDEAYLETLDGRRIFSYADNPLHVASYSIPFEGEISREELFEHMFTHTHLDDAVPFHFHYYNKRWSLCCSSRTKESLTEERYKVVIRSRFEDGHLKVGEVVAPGKSKDCIVFCAHLCHPNMFNDDLSGVVLGVALMRKILRQKNRHFTYRLVILPETIGSAAWLSHNQDLFPDIKAGLFLEMMATNLPHSLQMSHSADTRWDEMCKAVTQSRDPEAWTGDFATLTLNDERMFEGPGIGVPMPSLSRVTRPDSPLRPYPEYHSDHDNPATMSFDRLKDSLETVLELVDALENDRPVKPLFMGEIFCSRYKKIEYVKMFKYVKTVTYLLDSRNTPLDIARKTGFTLREIRNFLNILKEEELVEYLDDIPSPGKRI